MAGLEEIIEESREGESDGTGEEPAPSQRKSAKRKRPKKHWTNNSGDSDKDCASGQGPLRELKEKNERQNGEPGDGQRQDASPNPVDHRSQLYKHYLEKAEEYDRDFIKKRDEDLNLTLVPAGLYSAVTSAFIIYIHPEFKPNPNEEIAALLRVLLYKMDNTTLGGNIPEIPQWTGPPDAIVTTQALLYASLVASLFSVLFSILAKQWLDQYAMENLWGSSIQRARDRQRILHSPTIWMINRVFEVLPLLLQSALLLLGCALSRYLWAINIAIALITIGFTLGATLIYFLYVTAVAISLGSPFQTPGSLIISNAFRKLVQTLQHSSRWWSMDGTYSGVDAQSFGGPSFPNQGPDTLDIHCVSWILQESPDRSIQLPVLEYLATMATVAASEPSLVERCFDILTGCVGVINHNVVVTQGQEQLATASATCFLRTFSHLSLMDPTSGVLAGVRRHFNRVFPPETDFRGFPPFHYTLGAIHRLLSPDREHHSRIEWQDYKPPDHERAVVARALTELAQSEYRRSGRRKKVPRWIIRFALHSLSLDPPPSTSVVVDCLSVIAIDLGCKVPSARTATLNESTQLEEVSKLITRKLEAMTEAADLDSIRSRRKALTALFPCAVWRERDGQHEMLEASLHVAKASDLMGYMWYHIEPFVSTLLHEDSHGSLKLAAILASPHLPWDQFTNSEKSIHLWAAAVSAVPYTNHIGQSVIDTLLRIAYEPLLQPHIPVGVWSWLNKRPSLSPVCRGRYLGSSPDVLHIVRALGDLEILKSYLLLIWSEWDHLRGPSEMAISIREDFSGIEMGYHREDLLRHLDHVLGQLDMGLEHLRKRKESLVEDDVQQMKVQYGELRDQSQ